MDYYTVLGVSKNVSTADLKKAYRKSSLKWHPDKNENSDAAKKKFQEIGEAYGVLSDPQKKQIYDTSGKEGLENHQNNAGVNPNDIFSQFFGGGSPFGGGGSPFGGGGGKSGPRSGPDKRVEIQITIDDMINGSVKKLSLTRNAFCSKCKGSGTRENATSRQCTNCSGSGICVMMRNMGPMRVQQQFTCGTCNGEGVCVRDTDRCGTCAGRKIVQTNETITITIDKGSKEGDHIKLDEKADAVENCSRAGDIYILFKIQPHKTLSRHGDDLIVKQNILLGEALSGLSFVFEHPNHEKLLVEYAKIIRPNTTFKINGKGFYGKQSRRYGNLIFQFDILFPSKIDDQRKTMLKKILPKREEIDSTGLECYTLAQTNIDISPPQMDEVYEDIDQNQCHQM